MLFLLLVIFWSLLLTKDLPSAPEWSASWFELSTFLTCRAWATIVVLSACTLVEAETVCHCWSLVQVNIFWQEPTKAVFRCFLLLINFPAKHSTFAYCMSPIFGKPISGQFRISGNIFSASYEASEFCWQIAPGPPQHLRPLSYIYQTIGEILISSSHFFLSTTYSLHEHTNTSKLSLPAPPSWL